MTVPNVNEWMTSLSALQIVPPPKQHEPTNAIQTGKEPSIPPLPAAYYPEQRDDESTPSRSTTKHSRSKSIIDKRDDNNIDSAKNNGKEDVIPTVAMSSTKKKHQTMLAKKRGNERSTHSPSINKAISNGGSKHKSTKKITDILSTDDANKQYDNMIMVGTQRVYPRTLVQPTIYHNAATDLWIVTIHTDTDSVPSVSDMSATEPKAKQKAFSFNDENVARASAYANSPPILIPRGTKSQCMLCDTSFSFLRRSKHCKNCGIIICADCSTRWNVKMLPETYTTKSTLGLNKNIRVCVSCDAVAKRFKNALIMGRYDLAVEGYLTGNVNLRCPFVFKGDKEVLFPIHCAILGQSERLLRWLVDVQCCPIHLTSTANKGKKSYEEDALPTLQTSKGRSVMDISMETKHIGILKYLVKEKGVPVNEVKDLTLVWGALESMIWAFPNEIEKVSAEKDIDVGKLDKIARRAEKYNNKKIKSPARNEENAVSLKPQKRQSYHAIPHAPKDKTVLPRDISPMKNNGLYVNVGRYDNDDEIIDDKVDSDDDASVCTTMNEMCVVCSESPIDCVATPCGHQVCCLSCGENRIACPSCKVVCQFIEIYQP